MKKTSLKMEKKKKKINGVAKPLVFFFVPFFTASLCGFLPLFFALRSRAGMK